MSDHLKKEAKQLPFFISYFITDPLVFGDTKQNLEKNISNTLNKKKVDMICFRDKISKDTEKLAKTVLDISKKIGISKVVINSNIPLAIKLKFDGVHLTSSQFDDIKKAKQYDLFTIISCHNEDDIKRAKEKKADAVTYSPIFYKENKGKPKGIKDLKNMVKKYQDTNFRIIALGGIIDEDHIKQIQSTQASGFSSIRYFYV